MVTKDHSQLRTDKSRFEIIKSIDPTGSDAPMSFGISLIKNTANSKLFLEKRVIGGRVKNDENWKRVYAEINALKQVKEAGAGLRHVNQVHEVFFSGTKPYCSGSADTTIGGIVAAYGSTSTVLIHHLSRLNQPDEASSLHSRLVSTGERHSPADRVVLAQREPSGKRETSFRLYAARFDQSSNGRMTKAPVKLGLGRSWIPWWRAWCSGVDLK
jgi:hypothetical protein